MHTTLVDIKVLSLFFCNYSIIDIEFLQTCPEFYYFWNNKRSYYSDDTEVALWIGFSRYLDSTTQQFILDYARVRYWKEAIRSI